MLNHGGATQVGGAAGSGRAAVLCALHALVGPGVRFGFSCHELAASLAARAALLLVRYMPSSAANPLGFGVSVWGLGFRV